MDFHKSHAVKSSTLQIDNIISSSLKDDSYIIPQPRFYPKSSFADEYIKSVIAIVMNTKLLEHPKIMKEAKEKANQYIKIKGFNVGAYSDSKGLQAARKNLAGWYQERDGFKIEEDSIYLTNGAMNSYDHIISLMCEENESVILPNPCSPLYDRYNRANGVKSLFYNFEGLEEGRHTGEIDYEQLKRTVAEHRQNGGIIKALLIINPQSPLGTVLSEQSMQKVVTFCEENSLVLIAVETLQNSLLESDSSTSSIPNEKVVLKDSEGNFIKDKGQMFKSFRHVVTKMKSQVELFSIFSLSKGIFYNQGIRAGMLDYMNIDEEVQKQLYKYKSIDLCSGVPGQIFMDLCLNKPKEFGYEFLYNWEKSLKEFKREVYQAKQQIYENILKDDRFIARDIQAGHSFFLKTKTQNAKLQIGSKEIQSTNGLIYGSGLSNYSNYYINI